MHETRTFHQDIGGALVGFTMARKPDHRRTCHCAVAKPARRLPAGKRLASRTSPVPVPENRTMDTRIQSAVRGIGEQVARMARTAPP